MLHVSRETMDKYWKFYLHFIASFEPGEFYKEGMPYERAGFREAANQFHEARKMLDLADKYDFYYMLQHTEELGQKEREFVDAFRSIIDIDSPLPGWMEYLSASHGNWCAHQWDSEDLPASEIEEMIRKNDELRDDDPLKHDSSCLQSVREHIISFAPYAYISHIRFHLFRKSDDSRDEFDYDNDVLVKGKETKLEIVPEDEFYWNIERIKEEMDLFGMQVVNRNPKRIYEYIMKKLKDHAYNVVGIQRPGYYENPVPVSVNLAKYLLNGRKPCIYDHASAVNEIFHDEMVKSWGIQRDKRNPNGFKVTAVDFCDALCDAMKLSFMPQDKFDNLLAIVRKAADTLPAALCNSLGIPDGTALKDVAGLLAKRSKNGEEKTAEYDKAWESFLAKHKEIDGKAYRYAKSYTLFDFVGVFGALYPADKDAEDDINDKTAFLPRLVKMFGCDASPFEIHPDDKDRSVRLSVKERRNAKDDRKNMEDAVVKDEDNVMESSFELCGVLYPMMLAYRQQKRGMEHIRKMFDFRNKVCEMLEKYFNKRMTIRVHAERFPCSVFIPKHESVKCMDSKKIQKYRQYIDCEFGLKFPPDGPYLGSWRENALKELEKEGIEADIYDNEEVGKEYFSHLWADEKYYYGKLDNLSWAAIGLGKQD